jgi:sugar fermentation stimulation protein A
MQYQNICPGRFVARPNRFIAHVETAKGLQICHVKNTGRCRELLVPGAKVWLEESDNPARKTRYDLVSVEKQTESGPICINMDSQAPNKVFGEWAAAGGFRPNLTVLRPETRWGNSRFDYYWEDRERRGFVEVKGVTLEQDGIVRFPDAPTQRGVKHLEELVAVRAAGYEAAVCFVVQMEGMKWLEPNDVTHPQFGAALRAAATAGVEVLAQECRVTPDTLEIKGSIPVRL